MEVAVREMRLRRSRALCAASALALTALLLAFWSAPSTASAEGLEATAVVTGATETAAAVVSTAVAPVPPAPAAAAPQPIAKPQPPAKPQPIAKPQVPAAADRAPAPKPAPKLETAPPHEAAPAPESGAPTGSHEASRSPVEAATETVATVTDTAASTVETAGSAVAESSPKPVGAAVADTASRASEASRKTSADARGGAQAIASKVGADTVEATAEQLVSQIIGSGLSAGPIPVGLGPDASPAQLAPGDSPILSAAPKSLAVPVSSGLDLKLLDGHRFVPQVPSTDRAPAPRAEVGEQPQAGPSSAPEPPAVDRDLDPSSTVAAHGGFSPPLSTPDLPPSPGSATSGGGPGIGLLFPFLGLAVLVALAAPRGLRRWRDRPGICSATPFVCLLERPG